MLKEIFISLASGYTINTALHEKLWKEIQTSYTRSKRFYHTLTHLQQVLDQLSGHKEKILDWKVMLFSVFYHDIIYNVLKNNNEEKSAVVAENRMRNLQVPEQKIEKCKMQILATRSHTEASDTDTRFFVDADLSILGQDWLIYEQYYQNVRKEYSIFPDALFRPGRRKVLKDFLERERIFKTVEFFDAYEKQAKENLRRELNQ